MFEYREKRKTEPLCKVYVNGQPFNASWNNFSTPKQAFEYLHKNDLVGISILRDSVTIIETVHTIYDVDYYS